MTTSERQANVGIDESAFEAFVAREKKAILRAAASFGSDTTDEQAERAARDTAAMYRHHFRIWK